MNQVTLSVGSLNKKYYLYLQGAYSHDGTERIYYRIASPMLYEDAPTYFKRKAQAIQSAEHTGFKVVSKRTII